VRLDECVESKRPTLEWAANLRRFCDFQRLGRRGSKPGSQSWTGALGVPVRPCVSQPLADDPLEAFNCPRLVIKAVGNARVVAELELGNVAVQVMLCAVLVHAAHAALEDRERPLDGVRVDRAIIQIDVVASGLPPLKRAEALGFLRALSRD
jgi:hypothetical protein